MPKCCITVPSHRVNTPSNTWMWSHYDFMHEEKAAHVSYMMRAPKILISRPLLVLSLVSPYVYVVTHVGIRHAPIQKCSSSPIGHEINEHLTRKPFFSVRIFSISVPIEVRKRSSISSVLVQILPWHLVFFGILLQRLVPLVSSSLGEHCDPDHECDKETHCHD